MRKSVIILITSLALVLPLLFIGCEGDDGAQGPAGPPGPPGPPGTGGITAAKPESCIVCHGPSATESAQSKHAATGVATVGPVTVTPGASLVITFNVTVDGVPNDSFTLLRRGYVNYDDPANPALNPAINYIETFRRDTITDNVTLVSNGGGNYTVTVPTALQIDNATYLFQLGRPGTPEPEPIMRPVAVATNGTRHLRDLVTSTAQVNGRTVGCAACHGLYPAWSEKFKHYAVGGADCQICHTRYDRFTEYRWLNPATDNVESLPGQFYGTNLVEYVHGIHNSHNMPGDTYYRSDQPDDGPFSVEEKYSVGYPSYMRNCKVCHASTDQVARVASAPVSWYLCMTCHNRWDGFVHSHNDTNSPPAFQAGDPIITGFLSFHRNYSPDVDCMNTACHGAVGAKNEAADFHDYFDSSDTHVDSFYRGTDISFDNPDGVSFEITGLTKAGDNVSFTWTASKNGAAVDPCNTNLASGPTFRRLAAYLAYAKGDDWVNENVGSSPGQPAGARNLFTSLSTTCAANVATTTGLTIDPDANAYADKALLAIGGKPTNRGTFTIGTAQEARDYLVRVPSPTRAFSMADGSNITPIRRFAVATEKCLACHQGTLYQHGGDRVDNEQLCVICHNPASSDKNNRKESGGSPPRFAIVNPDGTVNTNATYDGKVSETYDMRVMAHSIHGVEKRAIPWVLYRTRGIYAFVPPVYEDVLRNGNTIRVERRFPAPEGWPLVNGEAPAVSENTALVFGSTTGVTQTHNWTIVHYPKPPSDCLACHNPEVFELPDQTKAVGVTVDAGGSNYLDQSDDTVIGPTAAACTACHATAPVRRHADEEGYRTVVTREEMLVLAQP